MCDLQAAGGAALNTDEAAAPPTTVTRRRAVGLLAVVAATVVLCDLITKQLAVAHLAGAEPIRLVGGAVYLTYVTNSGAAFGLGGAYTFVFPVVAFAVVAWIGWLALRLRSRIWALALALVLGGAVGNLLDRLFRPPGPFQGAVVDMVSVLDPYGGFFPVFNVADASLVVGVIVAMWLELTGRRRDGRREPVGEQAGGGPR